MLPVRSLPGWAERFPRSSREATRPVLSSALHASRFRTWEEHQSAALGDEKFRTHRNAVAARTPRTTPSVRSFGALNATEIFSKKIMRPAVVAPVYRPNRGGTGFLQTLLAPQSN